VLALFIDPARREGVRVACQPRANNRHFLGLEVVFSKPS
jgi:hypothetical protein